MVKFQKFYVTNGTTKARVSYHFGKRIGDDRDAITLYAKDYDRALGRVIEEGYKNDTEIMTDYFDKGRVTLFCDHPLYPAALARVEANRA